MGVKKSKIRATISTRGLEALCLDLAEVMFVALDITGRVTLINDAGCRIVGYTREELLEADWFSACVAPEDRRRTREVFRRLIRGEGREFKHVRGPVRTKSGEPRMLAWHNTALTDGEGVIIGTLSSGQDITEQWRAERDRTLLHEIALAAHEAGSVDEIFRTVIERVCEHMGWPLGHAWMPEEGGGGALVSSEIWSKAASKYRRFVAASRGLRFVAGEGLVGQVVEMRKPHFIADLASDRQFVRLNAAVAAGLASAAAFPVLLGEKTVAVLEFFAPRVERLDVAQLQVMDHIGSQLGRVVERTRAQEALRDSEARMRAVLETAVDCIITIDERGTIQSVNTAAERTFGYSRREMIGRNISMLMPAPYQQEHDAYIGRYLRTGKRKIIGIGREVLGLRNDGSVFPMDLAVSEVWQGGRRLFTGIVRDLTERNKMLQQIVHASSEEQQRIGQDLHDGLGQQLTGVAFLSDVMRQNLQRERSPHAPEAQEITELVNQAIAHLRALVKGLRPVELGGEGLSLALQDLAQTTSRLFGITCVARAEDVMIEDVVLAAHLYYIAKEAVHNAVRHAGARRVTITLRREGRKVILSVVDDGRGLPEGLETTSRGGLRIMAHRARMISGMLEIKRGRKSGTAITCRVDYFPKAPRGAKP